jgi:hypothetical protein
MKLFVGVKTWTLVTAIALVVAVFLGIVVHGQITKPPSAPECHDLARVMKPGGGVWECDARMQTLTAERLWADVYLFRCTCAR